MKLRKQSTEFKGLKRMFSLNNDPKEELSNDFDTSRPATNTVHIRNSNTMRSGGSGHYEGDNLIKVGSLEPKTWDEDNEVEEEDTRAGP